MKHYSEFRELMKSQGALFTGAPYSEIPQGQAVIAFMTLSRFCIIRRIEDPILWKFTEDKKREGKWAVEYYLVSLDFVNQNEDTLRIGAGVL